MKSAYDWMVEFHETTGLGNTKRKLHEFIWKIQQDAREQAIKECANIAWALSVSGHGPTSKPKLMARNIYNNIMSLVRE